MERGRQLFDFRPSKWARKGGLGHVGFAFLFCPMALLIAWIEPEDPTFLMLVFGSILILVGTVFVPRNIGTEIFDTGVLIHVWGERLFVPWEKVDEIGLHRRRVFQTIPGVWPLERVYLKLNDSILPHKGAISRHLDGNFFEFLSSSSLKANELVEIIYDLRARALRKSQSL